MQPGGRYDERNVPSPSQQRVNHLRPQVLQMNSGVSSRHQKNSRLQHRKTTSASIDRGRGSPQDPYYGYGGTYQERGLSSEPTAADGPGQGFGREGAGTDWGAAQVEFDVEQIKKFGFKARRTLMVDEAGRAVTAGPAAAKHACCCCAFLTLQPRASRLRACRAACNRRRGGAGN